MSHAFNWNNDKINGLKTGRQKKTAIYSDYKTKKMMEKTLSCFNTETNKNTEKD